MTANRSRSIAAGALLLLAGLQPVLAEETQVDVGLDKPITVTKGGLKKIALFIEIGTNSAVQSTVTGAKEEAAKHGIEVDVFDARFDIARQVNQMQNALLAGYDAWVVAAIEGNQVCDMAAKEAPKAGIPVAVVTMSICGRSVNEREQLWSPGTLTYIGGNETPSAFKKVIMQAVKDKTGPQKIALLTGQEIHPITQAFDKAVAEVLKEHPEVQVVATHRTDYSPEMNQQKTQNILQVAPDIDAIVGVYTNMSKGAAAALETAGRAGQVRLYEAGGTKWSVDAIKSGTISATTGYYRATAAATAVRLLVDAFDGKPVPHVVLNDGHALLPGQTPGEVAIITKTNVNGYVPESP
ncbi:MAG: sugar ABC transporter substrate-binding protein [Mesorhizobium sp.]|uniref:sugar ABC transporter substrate-binding protein n=2 Tax=unclassified Mesorhizobium TaxID=325217 RepID=UPI000F75F224|nr:sugar ABC transporter substrate-binding protein [Mesorhizobium sp.]AZO34802.1 sugar ABC transporter substrate-binding protein [Mesorhizobium sp. M2A.F.Ca.ET.046.03.2.1]RVC71062.1 sugar ABC transporter substrate-binding protein [Mesorhizobium sp. M00.F.Ca.ET.038.03.1.1]RVC82590.1 sugar ABC transporter substrate-binding protein [Mesorhizobium sp. M2A.F.Ca.ET.046.02.1.1]RWE21429.1 MAG: sugar ABC transporter substrate-binding protein [Mesorhizobium sp.]RWE99575.1 MAG: sugar ABC transporter subs